LWADWTNSQPSLPFGSTEKAARKVRPKWPEHFTNSSWILHHDYTPAHTALSVREFLPVKQITMLEHPPCSLDLAPSDIILYPKIRKCWEKGILMTLMTSGVIRQQLWRPFHKTSSKIVLKGGLGAGIGA
jgi:hypothetical protein